MGAAKVTLTKDEVKQLRALAEEIHKTAPGERYPGEFNDLSFLDTPLVDAFSGAPVLALV